MQDFNDVWRSKNYKTKLKRYRYMKVKLTIIKLKNQKIITNKHTNRVLSNFPAYNCVSTWNWLLKLFGKFDSRIVIWGLEIIPISAYLPTLVMIMPIYRYNYPCNYPSTHLSVRNNRPDCFPFLTFLLFPFFIIFLPSPSVLDEKRRIGGSYKECRNSRMKLV